MHTRIEKLAALTCLISAPAFAGGGGWVDYSNETSLRMPTPLNDPATSTNDNEEKDYAWGDVDGDGDTDLVVVRKQPFTSTGKRVNVLFMNEGVAEGHSVNGVLVDRTDDYAVAADIGGDNGFNTATNDRDVQLVDVDNDGWLDIVTATTLTDNQAKRLSHPRIYMNLGESGGNWLGFEYQDARIPQMHATAGPRFCSVAAKDVTGDGYADLYFGDYDSGGGQIFDYNNKLLINMGVSNPGFFSDESNARLTATMRLSAFGAASEIYDMNNDGVNDVVKQTSLNSPTHVAITYNNPGNEGFFNGYDTIYGNAPYFITVGDLNQDGKLDIVVVDDGTDRYMLNTGNSGGEAQFSQFTFPNSNGFGGNAIIRDLNNDSHLDVIITDVDVDISGCSRRTFVYRNLGNVPNVSFQEQGNPIGVQNGVHDVAVFDLDGDGWLDIVVGKCNGTQIWMNQPPQGLVFSYPQGLPQFVASDAPFQIDVQVNAVGGTPAPGSGKQFVSVSGGAFVESSMQDLGKDLYRATLPATPCPEDIRFYFSADLQGGGTEFDPPTGQAAPYLAISALGTEITFRDEFEEDVSSWTVTSQNLATGEWEAVDPNGAIFDGSLAAPEEDATQGEGTHCFVTEDGLPGGDASLTDLDGGPTYLMSPMIDLDGGDATISYARWFFCNDEGTPAADFLRVEISNDNGASWTEVTSETTGGTGGQFTDWEESSFLVSAWITPTAQMRVRFVASDQPNDSVTEAGIDNFQVEEVLCAEPCTGDIDGSGAVGFGDLTQLLSAWGNCPGCPEDLDGSGAVGFGDLTLLLAAWGPCP